MKKRSELVRRIKAVVPPKNRGERRALASLRRQLVSRVKADTAAQAKRCAA